MSRVEGVIFVCLLRVYEQRFCEAHLAQTAAQNPSHRLKDAATFWYLNSRSQHG
jgi:hypothetical protein